MKYQLMKRSIMLGLVALIMILARPIASQADPLVLAGFDLFQTEPGTRVNLEPVGLGTQPFIGVPLGTFDFGMGPVAVFNTDTIVQRLEDATPANPTIPLEVVALQLMSVNQFTLGGDTGFLFVTLQSVRGGPTSTGTMTITFSGEGGTFDSTLNIAFDMRFGSLDGPILFSDTLVLVAHDVLWSHIPAAGAVIIPGVNDVNSLFPVGSFEEVKIDQDGTKHEVSSATVPEPATISLLAIGIAGVAARVFKRRGCKQD
jgi:hypothetical protein